MFIFVPFKGQGEWGERVGVVGGMQGTTLNCFPSPSKVKEITFAKGDDVMDSGLLAKSIKPIIYSCFGATILMKEAAAKWSYWY